MAIALVADVKVSGLNGGTSSSIDTTGATLLVMVVVGNSGGSFPTISDNKGNSSWTGLTTQTQGSASLRIFYHANPAVGTGHTFTLTGASSASSAIISAWSGVITTSPFDVQQGGASAGATAAGVGSSNLVPSEGNELVIAAVGLNGSVSSYTAGSGFMLPTNGHQNFLAANYYGIGVVYQIQTTATTVTSATTCSSWTTSQPCTVASATFKSATGGPLTSGTASFSSATDTTINMAVAAASAGVSPYTYQWYRDTTASFTPGGGNLLSGATSITLADSASLSAETPYFYICRVTDDAAATADSNCAAGVLKAAAISIGCLGDSITKGTFGPAPASVTVPQRLAQILAKIYKQRNMTVTNQGVDGSSAQDWAANTGSILTTAKTAFASAGVTHVLIMLGANDCVDNRTAAQYKTDLQTIGDDLITAGYTVMINYPTFFPIGANGVTAAQIELLRQYPAKIDELVNGTTYLQGDKIAFQYFIDNYANETQTDRVHLIDAGNVSLANMWARAFDRAVLQTGGGGGGSGAGLAVGISGRVAITASGELVVVN